MREHVECGQSITFSADDFGALSAGAPNFVAFAAYGLLVVMFYPAPFIANFD